LPALTAGETLENAVAAMNAAIEQAVRQLPEQYLWSYKRFKTRPPGMPKVY
jgi:KDO2-lipid IV(A) lauroyltransferase